MSRSTQPFEGAFDWLFSIPVLVTVLTLLLSLAVWLVTKVKERYGISMRVTIPMKLLLTELTRNATAGSDKALFALLSPDVLETMEKGIVRAYGRCLVAEFGSFEDVVPITVRARRAKLPAGLNSVDPKQVQDVFVVTASAKFSKAKDDGPPPPTCSVTYYQCPSSQKPMILNFQVTAGDGEDPAAMNVTEHLDPADFEHYGERFVQSLLSADPSWALSVMMPGLQGKYASAEALATEVKKVIRVAGGFKGEGRSSRSTPAGAAGNSAPDVTHLKGEKFVANDSAKPTPYGVCETYHIAGLLRDMHAEVKIVFVGTKAQVLRYEFRAEQKLNEKQMIVDPDTGERTVVE